MKLPLYVKILIGMVLGLILSILATTFKFEGFVLDWIKPLGVVFMRLLKFIAIPLVFISLIKGVINLSNIKSLSSIGLRTIIIYMCTTVVAILLGFVLVQTLAPGKLIGADTANELRSGYSDGEQIILNADRGGVGPLQTVIDIFPENMAQAFSSNNNMLQVIFIALLFGVALLLIGEKRAKPVSDLIDSIDALLLKVVDFIMMYAPIGVFGLISTVVIDSAGDMSILSALGYYALVVIIGLLALIFGFYPLLIKLFTKTPVGHYLKSIVPVQLLAFSTSSSAATLPLTMDVAVKKLGISQKIASFVLPVGVTINMDGSSCYQMIAAVFIAQVLGIELSVADIALLVGLTTLSSIGTPGIPGGSIVVQVMVLTTLGIPAEGLALILGIDRPLDMIRTAVNVTGDLAVASIVQTSENKKENILEK